MEVMIFRYTHTLHHNIYIILIFIIIFNILIMAAPLQPRQQQGARHHRRYRMQRWFGTQTVGWDLASVE